MFGIQFYPTPPAIASKMVEPYRDLIKAGAYVLDPSAGKGDLLQAASYHTQYGHKDRLFAVEIDQNLQAILRQNKYKVIGTDWLRYSSHYHFDIILMNPPFANGDEHLLKAWDTLRGGHIACLLNAETIRNPHTAKRELLGQIIAKYGNVEFLGDVFRQSERNTDVDVALVRLHKPTPPRFGFEGIKTENMADRDFSGIIDNLPERRDIIASLVDTYDQVAKALEDYIRADLRLSALTSDLWTGFHRSNEEKDRLQTLHRNADGPGYFNVYMDMVKRAAWHQVFTRTNMRTIITDRVRKDWEQFQAEQGAAEFNHDNIMEFFDLLITNRNNILHQCVVDVFDRMTSYDKKNKIHFEGWKTNSAYKVNRKVILPWFVENWTGQWGNSLSVNHRKYDQMDDIDRAMCLITGKKFPDNPYNLQRGGETPDIVTFRDALTKCIQANKNSPGEGECEFFTFRYFLKGTVHLTFKDEYVWNEFNRQAAQGKGWIGDGE